MNVANWYRVSLLAVLLLPIGQASAVTCGDMSPDLTENGDRYYDLLPSDNLTASQQTTLKRIESNLRGKWRGTRDGYLCKGGPSSLRAVQQNQSVEVTIEQRSGNWIRISQELDDSENHQSHEILDLFPPATSQRILQLEGNVLSVQQKSRVQGALHEMLFLLEVTESRLRMARHLYVNGELAEAYQAELSR